MPEPAVTRLTISGSKAADWALRAHLGAQGLKKGALSKFIEDAVKWRLFMQTVGEVRQVFAGVSADRIDGMTGDALKRVRKDTRPERKGRTRK